MAPDRTDNTSAERAQPSRAEVARPADQGVTADSQVARVFAWRRGFNAMHLIDLGIRLGLFKAFSDTPDVSAQVVADRLGLHAPYVRAWCTTAYGFELLDADDQERFRLAPFVNEILANPGHPRYLGGYVRLGTEFATQDYQQAEAAFRTGATTPFQGRGREFAKVVAEATAGMNLVVARKILPSLPGVADILGQGGALLELGCGSGGLQIQIAKAFPNCRCAGVDIDPTGLAEAREAIEQAGLAERVQIIDGSPEGAIAPAAYDVVVMVEVLHEIAPSHRPAVVRNCFQALRPRGWLVIVDETYPATLAETRQPEFLFALQTGLEELLWGNVIPTRREQEELLRAAGFTGPIDRSLLGEGFTLLTASK